MPEPGNKLGNVSLDEDRLKKLAQDEATRRRRVRERISIESPLDAQKAEQYEYLMQHVADIVGPLRIEIDALQPSVLSKDPVALEAWKQTEAELRRILDTVNAFPPDHELRKMYSALEEPVRELFSSYLAKKKAYQEQKQREKLSKTTPLSDTSELVPENPGEDAPAPMASKFDTSELVPENLKGDYQPPAPRALEKVEDLSIDIPEEIDSNLTRPEDIEMSPQEYERAITRILEEVLQIEQLLELQGGKMVAVKRYDKEGSVREVEQVNVTDEMLQALQGFEDEMRRLDRLAGSPKSSMRKSLEAMINELGVKWHGRGPVAEFQPPRQTVSSGVWMPRVPLAPYRMRMFNAPARRRATLAVVQEPMQMPVSTPAIAMPDPSRLSLPGDFHALDEQGKTKAMEILLENIRTEKNRIVTEHEAVIKRLTEEIKERKLEELRASLNQ